MSNFFGNFIFALIAQTFSRNRLKHSAEMRIQLPTPHKKVVYYVFVIKYQHKMDFTLSGNVSLNHVYYY